MFSNKNSMPLNELSIFDPRTPYAKGKYQTFNKVNNNFLPLPAWLEDLPSEDVN